MTYTSAIESSGQFANDTSVPSAAPLPALTKTEMIARSSASPASAIDAIASDSAKVSLAGAMLSQACTGSDVRFDKVAALQQSIQAGTYGVTSANIAGRLLNALPK